MEEKLANTLEELSKKYNTKQLGGIIRLFYSGKIGWDGERFEKMIPGATDSYFKLYDCIKELGHDDYRKMIAKVAQKYLLKDFDDTISTLGNIYYIFLNTSIDIVQYENSKDDSYCPKNPVEFIEKVREFIHTHPETLAELWMDCCGTTFCPYGNKDTSHYQYTYTTHDDAIKYLESIANKTGNKWVVDWMKFYKFEKDSFECLSEHKGPRVYRKEDMKVVQ